MKATQVIIEIFKAIGRSTIITFLLLIAVIVLQLNKCESDRETSNVLLLDRERTKAKMIDVSDSIVTNQLSIMLNQSKTMMNQDSVIARQKRIIALQKKILEQ